MVGKGLENGASDWAFWELLPLVGVLCPCKRLVEILLRAASQGERFGLGAGFQARLELGMKAKLYLIVRR